MPRADACPCCGQALPRDFSFSGLRVEGKQREVLEAVMRAGSHGIHSERLFDKVYWQDEDGGPNFSCLAVTISQLNKKLAPFGKKVHAGRGSRFYALKDIK
jgi:DNA-binding response OmpR family regulator